MSTRPTPIPDLDGIRVGWTTLPSHADADRLASGLVREGLAACAQVDGPLKSHYRWEGKICCDDEWRVTVKFASVKAELVEAWLKASHPHAIPQWVAVEAAQVLPKYRAWILGDGSTASIS